MKKTLAILAIAALAISGCASTMTINQQAVTVGGRTIHYVFAESQNEAGLNFTVADRYDENGNLLTKDAASNNGIMQAVVPAIISGGATAGGLVGAAAVLRPDVTTITQTGGTATATGGTASSSPTNVSQSFATGYASSSSGSSASVSEVQKPVPHHEK